MSTVTLSTVTLSSKGQLVIPEPIRAAHGWKAGTEFVIEDRPDGLLLRPRSPFPPTAVDQVFGCLQYSGPAKTVEEMDEHVESAVIANFDGSVEREGG